MSVKTSTWVWNPDNCPVSGNRLLVMLALADMANDDGECYPGKANLARKLRIGLRAIKAIIDDLEEKGLITITSRKRPDGSSTSNIYKICMGGEESGFLPGGIGIPGGRNQDSSQGESGFLGGRNPDSSPSIETSLKHQRNGREKRTPTPFEILIEKDKEL